jgi:hypothetical protein
MKCPKCGYHSFDHLDSCKKCGQGLAEHKARFNLHGFYAPAMTATTETSAPAADNLGELDDGSIDFKFLRLDEPAGGNSPGARVRPLDINQPFAVDSETIPADDPAGKRGKGPEFAF